MKSGVQRSRHLSLVRSALVLLLLLPVTAVVLTGCGKKTYPRPLSQLVRPELKDLHAKVTSKGVELSWLIPENVREGGKREQHHFMLYKSEIKWEDRACPECPPLRQDEGLRLELVTPQPARIEGSSMVWLDTRAVKSHAYRYFVTLIGKKQRELARSSPVMVKVVSAPASLKDLQVSTTAQGIMLQWKSPSKDVEGQTLQGEIQYAIDRRPPNGQWEKLSTVPIKANNFLDKSIASNLTYDYRVTPMVVFEGTSVAGEPALFSQAQAPGSVPPPPPKSVWVIPGKGGIEVQWTESDGKNAGYHVYRKEGKEITRLTDMPIQKAPYFDRAIKHNVLYSYAVSAVNEPDQKEGLLSKWVEIRSLMVE
ncbi:MAG: fibronectin type III domain-containing protein [Syntrophobacteraceae bacterium]